jgi:hypothetical protein
MLVVRLALHAVLASLFPPAPAFGKAFRVQGLDAEQGASAQSSSFRVQGLGYRGLLGYHVWCIGTGHDTLNSVLGNHVLCIGMF